MEPVMTSTVKPYKPSASIYDAWSETLLPFLVPAMVLTVWPAIMVVRARHRAPIKLLAVAALTALADGLLGSCAFPLQHQYAHSLATNTALFYVGTTTYWLSGVVLGPLMELLGCRLSCMALAIIGIIGAWGSGRSTVLFALVGRAASAAATSGLATWAEYALYDEVQQHRKVGADAADGKTGALDSAAELGGGTLTILNQLRPVMQYLASVLSAYTMAITPTVSVAPSWVAGLCYVGVLLLVQSLSWPPPTRTAPATTVAVSSHSTSFTPAVSGTFTGGNIRGPSAPRASTGAAAEDEGAAAPHSALLLPGAAVGGSLGGGRRWKLPPPRQLLQHYARTYITSVKTLVRLRYLARHCVEIVFGAVMLAASLLWVPTLELYDDSVPFGLVFQLFMLTTLLGSTFALPVWAVSGAEAALVVLLSLCERTLLTSRDYAIPVTIMLAGIVLHLTHGALCTTGSLWRAGYPSGTVPLTYLFVVKACTGVLGWVFLDVMDGVFMEDAFVFEGRWTGLLLWVEAVALTQAMVTRLAPTRDRAGGAATVTSPTNRASTTHRVESGNLVDMTQQLHLSHRGGAAAVAGPADDARCAHT
ncbi:hypothetical protein NESM_000405400 [Novymonas esmeraldas]|uniref:Uncharacterized protein n=1 Tax=Novymonas esmeraldas TaxID=1808958 RepID=A0AAW0ENR8_9TRYP